MPDPCPAQAPAEPRRAAFVPALAAGLCVASAVALCGGPTARAIQLRAGPVDTSDWARHGVLHVHFALLDDEGRNVPGVTVADVSVRADDPVGGPVGPTLLVTTEDEADSGRAIAALVAAHEAFHTEPESGAEPSAATLAVQGLERFLADLDPVRDRSAVYFYSASGVLTAQYFTNDVEDTIRAARRGVLRFGGGAGADGTRVVPRLYSSILEVVEERFGAGEALPARRVLLVLTDGLDGPTERRLDRGERFVEDVVSAATDCDVEIWTIALDTPPEAEPLLRAIAARTGGGSHVFRGLARTRLPAALAGIREEIGGRYVATVLADALESDQATTPLPLRLVVQRGGNTLVASTRVPLPPRQADASPLPWLLLSAVAVALLAYPTIRAAEAVWRRGAAWMTRRRTAGDGAPARLVVVAGPHSGREFPLRPGWTTVGRAVGNAIRLRRDPSCSARHAVVWSDGAQFEILDLCSGPGTLANGEPVDRLRLRSGDRLRVGSSEITFERD
jgi:hypothetical protein